MANVVNKWRVSHRVWDLGKANSGFESSTVTYAQLYLGRQEKGRIDLAAAKQHDRTSNPTHSLIPDGTPCWERRMLKCKNDFVLAGLEAVCGCGGQEGGEDAAEEADQGSGCQVRREQIYVTTYESTQTRAER